MIHVFFPNTNPDSVYSVLFSVFVCYVFCLYYVLLDPEAEPLGLVRRRGGAVRAQQIVRGFHANGQRSLREHDPLAALAA